MIHRYILKVEQLSVHNNNNTKCSIFLTSFFMKHKIYGNIRERNIVKYPGFPSLTTVSCTFSSHSITSRLKHRGTKERLRQTPCRWAVYAHTQVHTFTSEFLSVLSKLSAALWLTTGQNSRNELPYFTRINLPALPAQAGPYSGTNTSFAGGCGHTQRCRHTLGSWGRELGPVLQASHGTCLPQKTASDEEAESCPPCYTDTSRTLYVHGTYDSPEDEIFVFSIIISKSFCFLLSI